MNWDAVGAIANLLGAIGVLSSLVYFGIQIRRIQQSEMVNSLTAAQQGELMINAQLGDSATLLVKANSGGDLTEPERYKLRKIAESVGSHGFFGYARVRAGGRNSAIIVRNFASLLADNPAIADAWLTLTTQHQSRRKGIDDRLARDWADAVKKDMQILGIRNGA